MRKLLALVLAVAMLASISGVALAENYQETGNGALSGPHYTLNIIGVPRDKTADMTGTSGHTIFVKLQGNSKIWLANSDTDEACAKDFIVLDRNGTDNDGAAFCLPAPDPENDGETLYTVFARALGTPGGQSFTTTCAIDDQGDTWCSSITMKLERNTGKSKFTDVSKYLLYIYVDITDDDTVNLQRYPLFDDAFESYFWNYDNNGLKVAQLRFYMTPTTVPEAGDVPSMEITVPDPAEGTQGQTLDVTFANLQNCDFRNVTVDDVYFGKKITVNSIVSSNQTTLTVSITIDNHAVAGDRLVYVTMPNLDPDETVNATFTVVAAP